MLHSAAKTTLKLSTISSTAFTTRIGTRAVSVVITRVVEVHLTVMLLVL